MSQSEGMNQWGTERAAAWVADTLRLTDAVAEHVKAEFVAKDIEGDGLMGKMKRVQHALATILPTAAAASEAVDTLCAERDGMHSSTLLGSTHCVPAIIMPQSPQWPDVLAGPADARQGALQGALEVWHAGRWVVQDELGQGGCGVVLGASDTRLGRVAIKFSMGEDARKAEREAALMQRVAHEHVCKIFEHSILDGGLSAMVLELLSGGSLEEVLRDSADGRIREFEVVKMASHVLLGVGWMHSKDVIHRDFKPSNIMLTEVDGRKVYKIIDLSVSAIQLAAQDQVSNTLMTNATGLRALRGTPHYMSPEQFKPDVAVSHQTDLWSLGVVLYECLSGVKPFAHGEVDDHKISYAVVNTEAPMLPDIIAEVGVVGDNMTAFVSHCLQKDLSARFKTAAEMSAALEETLSAGGDDNFALFISYRVWCESEFAQKLFKATSATQLREGREHRMNVYLDKVCLLDGQRFDVGFIKGLASSTVFAPLMSEQCMQSFADLEQKDKADFVLMEWIVAIELQKRGIVKAIFPIVMGKQGEDGKYEQFFFETLLQGQVAGQPLPDIVSKMTTEKAREFLGMLEEPVELSEELTVKQVVETILTFQAILLHFENDAIDTKTGLAKKGTMKLRESHGGKEQEVALQHVVSVCAERIAKVVRANQPELALEPELELDPEPVGDLNTGVEPEPSSKLQRNGSDSVKSVLQNGLRSTLQQVPTSSGLNQSLLGEQRDSGRPGGGRKPKRRKVCCACVVFLVLLGLLCWLLWLNCEPVFGAERCAHPIIVPAPQPAPAPLPGPDISDCAGATQALAHGATPYGGISCPGCKILHSGETCHPDCDEGYSTHGVRSCVDGVLTDTASCDPDGCIIPTHGFHMSFSAGSGAGICTLNTTMEKLDYHPMLPSGNTCVPGCDQGYSPRPQGRFSCRAGVLTGTAACDPDACAVTCCGQDQYKAVLRVEGAGLSIVNGYYYLDPLPTRPIYKNGAAGVTIHKEADNPMYCASTPSACYWQIRPGGGHIKGAYVNSNWESETPPADGWTLSCDIAGGVWDCAQMMDPPPQLSLCTTAPEPEPQPQPESAGAHILWAGAEPASYHRLQRHQEHRPNVHGHVH